METAGRRAIRDLLLLSLTAGSADAAGYLGLGRVFTSNMTGNLVLLGLALGQGHLAAARRAAFVLACFVAGVCVGAELGRHLGKKDWDALVRRLIRLEAVAVVLYALGWFLAAGGARGGSAYGFLALLALAMGLQSAAMSRLSLPGVTTTAVTSTFTALGAGIARLLFGPVASDAESGTNRVQLKFQAMLIGLYCVGAALGGVMMMHAPRFAGLVPALPVLWVALGMRRR